MAKIPNLRASTSVLGGLFAPLVLLPICQLPGALGVPGESAFFSGLLRAANFHVPGTYFACLTVLLLVGLPLYGLSGRAAIPTRRRLFIASATTSAVLTVCAVALQSPPGIVAWILLSPAAVSAATQYLNRSYLRVAMIPLVVSVLSIAILVSTMAGEARFWRATEVAADEASPDGHCFVSTTAIPWRLARRSNLPPLSNLVWNAVVFNLRLTPGVWGAQRAPHFALVDAGGHFYHWSFGQMRFVDSSARYPDRARLLSRACASERAEESTAR